MHLIHRWTLFLPPLGFESVGSPNMCKVDEAKRSHRQRQVLAVESRRHSGGVWCVSMAFASQQLAKKCLWIYLPLFPLPSVSVRQFRWNNTSVVTRPAKVYRHLQGARWRGVGPTGQRGIYTRLFRRQGQKDLLHRLAQPWHSRSHLRGKGACAKGPSSVHVQKLRGKCMHVS